MIWESVGIVNNEHMNVPHVLQQEYIHEDDTLVPTGHHRLVSINELDGVGE